MCPTNHNTQINKYTHGDICAAIVNRYNINARIGSVQVLDPNSGKGKLADAIAAINWCVQHEIRIINLSLGSVQAADYLPLFKCLKEAHEAGTVVIAACKNGRQISFPASFPFTIGVKADEQLKGDEYRLHSMGFDGIDFVASSLHQLGCERLPWITPFGNSFAAPLISAKVCEIIANNENATLEQVKRKLSMESLSSTYADSICFEDDLERKVMDVDCFVKKTLMDHPAKKMTKRLIPMILFVGDGLKGCIETLSHMIMNENHMPLLLCDQEVRSTEDSIKTDSPIKAMQYANELAQWFSADIIFMHISNGFVDGWPIDIDVPDMIIYSKVFNDPVLERLMEENDGEMIEFKNAEEKQQYKDIIDLLFAN